VVATNQVIIDKMQDGELYFFTEAWWPGLDQLLYYRDIMKLDVRFAGLFHAASTVPGDFSENWEWALWSEWAWMSGLDKIVVATNYMKRCLLLAKSMGLDPAEGSINKVVDKIEVTGLPIPEEWHTRMVVRTRAPLVPPGEEPIVIFNHRWAEDKGKDSFLELAKRMEGKAKFRVLTPRKIPHEDVSEYPIEAMICPTKEAYFDELKKGHFVISFATLETFGYSILEGLYHGLCPIVPARACYPELYPRECLFGIKDPVAPLTDVMHAEAALEKLILMTRRGSISFPNASDLSQSAANNILQVLYEEANK